MATSDEEAQMDEFCRLVGELVLWAAILDERVTRAVMLLFMLKPSPFLPSIVAEIDVRPKLDMIKARAKKIEAAHWRGPLISWAKHVENVNGYRNTVAHSQVKYENGRILLWSLQSRKLLKNMGKAAPSADHIRTWIDAAKAAVEEGDQVLSNLKSFMERFGAQIDEMMAADTP